jgi:hypothetical protein
MLMTGVITAYGADITVSKVMTGFAVLYILPDTVQSIEQFRQQGGLVFQQEERYAQCTFTADTRQLAYSPDGIFKVTGGVLRHICSNLYKNP